MSIVIDHVGLRATDLAASRAMYEAALAELGFTMLGEGEFEGDAYVLFGHEGQDDFCLHSIGSKPGVQRHVLRGVRARPGRQQRRGGVSHHLNRATQKGDSAARRRPSRTLSLHPQLPQGLV
jgi:catechol 2,3-dioxygenase-like lactoylglutathione lyase family enzyme